MASASAPAATLDASTAGAFPPAPFEVVAEITGARQWFSFMVRSGDDADYPLPVGNGGVPDGEPGRATPPLRVRGDRCERMTDRAAGWPNLGVLDLNHEPDHLFGIQRAPVQVDVDNEQTGARVPVAVDTEDAASGWMVTTRREEDGYARVSSELWRWSSTRWSRAETSPLGVEWRFGRPFGHGLLLVAVDARDVAGRISGRWSILPRGVARDQVAPRLANRDDEAMCSARVLGFEVFPSGEVLSAGATCLGKLLVEHWAPGAADATTREVATVDVDVHDRWPVKGPVEPLLHELDVPVEILGAGKVRARASDGHVFDVERDPTSGGWSAHPSTEKLTVDRVRAVFAPFVSELAVQGVYPGREGAAYVSGARLGTGAPTTMLLRDRPMKTRCSP
jgi:hypothetical protein